MTKHKQTKTFYRSFEFLLHDHYLKEISHSQLGHLEGVFWVSATTANYEGLYEIVADALEDYNYEVD